MQLDKIILQKRQDGFWSIVARDGEERFPMPQGGHTTPFAALEAMARLIEYHRKQTGQKFNCDGV